jgi:hypothetical protein
MVLLALFFMAKNAAMWARPHIKLLAEGKMPFTD